jgi:cell division control protein 6
VVDKLDAFFQQYMETEPLFKDKKFLQSNYIPSEIIHREDQISHLAKILAPALRGDKPSNVFIYGKTGTGKTLTAQFFSQKLLIAAAQSRQIKPDLPELKIIYLNCKLKRIADTEYRLIAQLAREFGKDIPPTGLPTDEVYKVFTQAVDNTKQIVILVLDEVDQLVKKTGDEIIYSLTRMNTDLQKSQISLVGISNDLMFTDHLDPRVRSSLSEEELMFPPYNALQIQHILKERSQKAFLDGALESGVIEKCAALTAREHGDARRALELLRVAGELAERDGSKQLSLKYVDEAELKIERDRVFDIIATQPRQFQAVLYAIIQASNIKKEYILTGEIYTHYKTICTHAGLRPLTQRRVSDILAELDMLGIINAKITSKGRYGRTREISLAIPSQTKVKVAKVLKDSLE